MRDLQRHHFDEEQPSFTSGKPMWRGSSSKDSFRSSDDSTFHVQDSAIFVRSHSTIPTSIRSPASPRLGHGVRPSWWVEEVHSTTLAHPNGGILQPVFVSDQIQELERAIVLGKTAAKLDGGARGRRHDMDGSDASDDLRECNCSGEKSSPRHQEISAASEFNEA